MCAETAFNANAKTQAAKVRSGRPASATWTQNTNRGHGSGSPNAAIGNCGHERHVAYDGESGRTGNLAGDAGVIAKVAASGSLRAEEERPAEPRTLLRWGGAGDAQDGKCCKQRANSHATILWVRPNAPALLRASHIGCGGVAAAIP